MRVERSARVTVKTRWTLPQAHILLALDCFGSGVRNSLGVRRSSMAAADASIMAIEGKSVHASDSMWACVQKSANLNTVWGGVNKIASENGSTYRAVPFCTNTSDAIKFARLRYARVRCELFGRKINWDCHELSMLLRNNGPANPKCDNVSAVWKRVNTAKNTLALHCYAWASKMRRQRGNRHKSAAGR